MKKAKIFLALILMGILPLMLTCGGGGGGGGGGGSGGGTTPEASATIGPSGGTVEVTNPSSPLYGVKVEIPAGALNNSTVISTSKENSPPPITSEMVPLSPIVRFDPDGINFNLPVKITLPYNKTSVGSDELVSPFVYSGTQSYWYVPVVTNIDKSSGKVEILTTHFSHYLVALIDKISGWKPPESWDTGFRPNLNGFPISNTADVCGGMAGFSKWYFDNYRECKNLYSIDTQTAKEIANSAQSLTKEPDFWTRFKTAYRTYFNWKDFLYIVKREIAKSNSPIIIGKITRHSDGATTNHAGLAYRYDSNAIWLYDPNYSGQEFIMTEALYNDPNSDYIVTNKTELYKPDDFNNLFDSYKDYLCIGCANIAGTWNGISTYGIWNGIETLRITLSLSQDECNVSGIIKSPESCPVQCGFVDSGTITGSVSGNTFTFTVAEDPWVDCESCEFICYGTDQGSLTVSGNRMYGTAKVEDCEDKTFINATLDLTRSSSTSSLKTLGKKKDIRKSSILSPKNCSK